MAIVLNKFEISMNEELLVNKYRFKKVRICPEEDENCKFVRYFNHELLGPCELDICENHISLYCIVHDDEVQTLLLRRELNDNNLIKMLAWLESHSNKEI
jgi:hypothetical protein